MTDAEKRTAAKQFAVGWQGKGYEKGHSQPFCFLCLATSENAKVPTCPPEKERASMETLMHFRMISTVVYSQKYKKDRSRDYGKQAQCYG